MTYEDKLFADNFGLPASEDSSSPPPNLGARVRNWLNEESGDATIPLPGYRQDPNYQGAPVGNYSLRDDLASITDWFNQVTPPNVDEGSYLPGYRGRTGPFQLQQEDPNNFMPDLYDSRASGAQLAQAQPEELPSPPGVPEPPSKLDAALLNYAQNYLPTSFGDLGGRVAGTLGAATNAFYNPMGSAIGMASGRVSDIYNAPVGSQEQWNKAVALGLDTLGAARMFPKIGGMGGMGIPKPLHPPIRRLSPGRLTGLEELGPQLPRTAAPPYVRQAPLSAEQYQNSFRNAVLTGDENAAVNLYRIARKNGTPFQIGDDLFRHLTPRMSMELTQDMLADIRGKMSEMSGGVPPPGMPAEDYARMGMGDIIRTNPEQFTNPPPKFPMRDVGKGELPISSPEFAPKSKAEIDQSISEAHDVIDKVFQGSVPAQVQAALDKIKDAAKERFGDKWLDNPYSKFIKEGEARAEKRRVKELQKDLGKISADSFWKKYFEDLNPNKVVLGGSH